MTVAPRFVRMLLSTSWAHCEAAYNRAGGPYHQSRTLRIPEKLSETNRLRRFHAI
jgi:hypothetical protein